MISSLNEMDSNFESRSSTYRSVTVLEPGVNVRIVLQQILDDLHMTLLSSHVKRSGTFQCRSVHICVLFNQMLDDLEVTFLCCNIQRSVSYIQYDVSSGHSCLIMWADRTSTVGKVHVGSELEQSLHCIHMAVLGSHIERGRAISTHFVNHSTLLAKQSNHIRVTILSSHVQWAVTLLYNIWVHARYVYIMFTHQEASFGVSSSLEQQLDHFHVTILGGDVKRRGAITFFSFNVSSSFE